MRGDGSMRVNAANLERSEGVRFVNDDGGCGKGKNRRAESGAVRESEGLCIVPYNEGGFDNALRSGVDCSGEGMKNLLSRKPGDLTMPAPASVRQF